MDRGGCAVKVTSAASTICGRDNSSTGCTPAGSLKTFVRHSRMPADACGCSDAASGSVESSSARAERVQPLSVRKPPVLPALDRLPGNFAAAEGVLNVLRAAESPWRSGCGRRADRGAARYETTRAALRACTGDSSILAPHSIGRYLFDYARGCSTVPGPANSGREECARR